MNRTHISSKDAEAGFDNEFFEWIFREYKQQYKSAGVNSAREPPQQPVEQHCATANWEPQPLFFGQPPPQFKSAAERKSEPKKGTFQSKNADVPETYP